MKIPFIVFFLFLNISLSFSQTIQVLDETDKKPIPYVTVLLTSHDNIIDGDYCDTSTRNDLEVKFGKMLMMCLEKE